MRRIGFALAAVALVGAACASSSHTVSAPPTTAGCGGNSTAHRNLAYGSDPAQALDLYLPNCDPGAFVVYVHGGGFVKGDKANQIDNKVRLFTGAGYAFASVNYRLDVKYPTAENDVAGAVGYLAQHASQYRYDPHRILLLGHSSGAFPVSLVSTDPSLLARAGVPLSDVRCTVSLDTTYDIPLQIARHTSEEKMYRNAFGNDPAVWKRGSPIANIASGKHIPTFRIVTRGARARVDQAEAFAASLRTAGVHADVQNANPMTHAQVNQAVGTPGDNVITPPIMQLYGSCR